MAANSVSISYELKLKKKNIYFTFPKDNYA